MRRQEQQGEYSAPGYVLEDAAGLPLVVAPGGKQLGRNLFVRVAYYFNNEGKLSMRNLIADRWDIEEPFAD